MRMFYNENMPLSSFFEKLSPERLRFLFGEDTHVAGLDIGSSSVKLVQLRAEKERAILETYGEVAFGPYKKESVGRVVPMPEDRMSEVIGDLWQEAGATAKQVIVGMPLKNSFITFLDLPVMVDKELARAIPFEARKYIPLPLSEVEIDWWPITPLANKEEEGMEITTVLLAAIQKETIESYRRILKGASLHMRGFEIEIFSVARAASRTIRSSHLVLDIGASSTKAAIVDRGSLRMTRAIDRGAQAFTLGLSHALGVDFARAEEAKRESGIAKRPETAQIRNTLLPLIDALFDEAERLPQEYERRSGRTVDKIILVGAAALMPGLLDYAIERFRREVFFAESFASVSYPPMLSAVMNQLGAPFAQAVGLALRGLPQ